MAIGNVNIPILYVSTASHDMKPKRIRTTANYRVRQVTDATEHSRMSIPFLVHSLSP